MKLAKWFYAALLTVSVATLALVRADENENPEAAAPAHFHLAGGEVYCGGEPTGEGAFLFLQQQGIQTIVSVDGAMPDTDLAAKYGMRYVHIPFGYDGVPEQAQLSLARLMRDIEGPKFIHCHHGKHRGPVGAAIALLAANQLDPGGAKQLLEKSGTSPDYTGLWKSVATFMRPADDAALPALVAVAEVDSFAAAMARADRYFDALKAMSETDWATPSDAPDMSAAHEAVLLWEAFNEAGRHLDSQPEAMKSEFEEALGIADQLRTALAGENPASQEDAGTAIERLSVSCKSCHVKFR
ncbi:MAG: hypothetical protein R3F19_34935 [Verrucomicrobiales bacterium]